MLVCIPHKNLGTSRLISRFMENIATLKLKLSVPQDIVITSHRNPDGDAIGSSLAMYHYLVRHGHSVKMIVPSEYPFIFEWMPAIKEMLVFDIDQEKCLEEMKEASIIFCLDYNSLDRIDKLAEPIDAEKQTLILIDHHLDPDIPAEFSLSDPSASSTCELVYEFIQLMDADDEIDVTIGEALFTGILTDTGSFKYSTTPKLFKTVAALLEKGVDDYKLQDLIFNSLTEKQLRLLGHCLYNRMQILEDYKTGIITLNRKDYEEFDIQRGDTEGIVNFILKIRNINVAAFITEQPNIVKLSLRSKGDFSVQEIARKYFKGGGHKNASGGYSFGGLRATVNKFKEILPEYKDALQY